MNRRILHGVAAGAIYTAMAAAVGVVQFCFIVRALRAEMAGLWLLFVAIGSWVAVFDLGISPTVGREISFSLGDPELSRAERVRRIGELLATLRHLFRAVAVCAGLACVGLGEAIIFFGSRYRGNPAVGWAWLIFSAGIALNLLGGAALAGLYGLGEVASEKTIRCAGLLVGLALTLGALRLRCGIAGLAAAWMLQGSLIAMLAWLRLRHRVPDAFGAGYRPNWTSARAMVSPSIKLASIQLGAILILQSANPLIAILIGTAAIPSYEAASKIAVTMMTLALLIVNSSSPFFSMTYAAGDLAKMTLLLLRNLRLGVGVMVGMAAFVAVNGDRIIAAWLAPSMFAGFPVLWVLLLMVLLEVHHVIFATGVMAAGRIVFAGPALLSGVLNILLAIALAGRLGLLGIALAVAVGQLVTNNWYAPYVAIRFFHLSGAVLVREVWAPMGVLLAGSLAADYLIRQMPWMAGLGLAPLAASGVLSFASGAGMWWLLALRSTERAQIRDYFGNCLARVKVEHA